MAEPQVWQGKEGNGSDRDFSQPIAFDLRIQKPNKTIDIGQNGISLSLDACGRVRMPINMLPAVLN